MNQPAPQRKAPPNRTPLFAAISVIGSIGGSAAIGYYTVVEWMEPITPLVVAATAVLLPLLAINCILALVLSERHASIAPTLQKPVLLSVVFGLLAIGAAASWNSQKVRKRAIAQATDRGMRQAVIGALEDPSEQIVTEACVGLFKLGVPGHRQELLELLDTNPELARRCLKKAGSDKIVGEVGRVLGERWHAELLARSGSGPSRRCAVARSLGRLPRAASVGLPALLSCSLQAPMSKVRTCCADQVVEVGGKGEELADALGDSITATIAERLAPRLVQASLHQLQLDDEQKARFVRMGLTRPEMRRYTAGFACALTMSRSRTNATTNQMAAWLDDRACSSDIPAVDQNINAWHRVCGYILDNFAEADKPADLICEAARADALIAGVEDAKATVKSAFAGAKDQFMEAQILAGVALQHDRANGALNFLDALKNSGLSGNKSLSAALQQLNDPEFRKKVERIVVATSSLSDKSRKRLGANTIKQGTDGKVEFNEEEREQIDAQFGADKRKELERGLENLRNQQSGGLGTTPLPTLD
jgi:hypothetical protein